MEQKALAEKIIATLEDKKALDIKLIDLHEKGAFADYMIIATATSTRQVFALMQYVEEVYKSIKIHPHVEGRTQCEWILIYGADIVIHLLLPETRDFYQIEKMWQTPFDDIKDQDHKTLY
ncbi:MAG: ribosome silencing factor [Proteobacteria bacterium]|nr:ribosome silencing factor [Pseudomonadota bacterium]